MTIVAFFDPCPGFNIYGVNTGKPVSGLCVCIYRVIQGERSMFWEVIVSVTVRKKFHVNMCLILNGYRDRAV